jgi:DNA invertase Pin-like site-specific DNA recombinase
MGKKYIAYYRVSTRKQEASGLGLSAQKQAVAHYILSQPLFAEFAEIESGTSEFRPQLLQAINLAKQSDAILIIAKLDRLSRNVAFISNLMESKVKFVCCDMPDATNLTIHIFAALAQWERERISLRTKEALNQLKMKGKILGNPSNLTLQAKKKGAQRKKEIALHNLNNIRAREMARLLSHNGLKLQQIAEKLNSSSFLTSRNKKFRAETIRRLLNVNP